MPVDGAGPFRMTVPVEDVPRETEGGFKVRDRSSGARTARVALRVTPLKVAEMVAFVFDATGVVFMRKLAF